MRGVGRDDRAVRILPDLTGPAREQPSCGITSTRMMSVRENDRVKVCGSGLISSHDDAANALGPKCDRRPFALDRVLAQPLEIDRFRDVLFVVDSFEALFDAVETHRRRRAVQPCDRWLASE